MPRAGADVADSFHTFSRTALTAVATRAVWLCSTNLLAGFGGSIARNCSQTQISSIFAHAAVVKHFLEGHRPFSKDPGFRSEIHSLQCCAGSPSACFRRQNRNLRHVQGRHWGVYRHSLVQRISFNFWFKTGNVGKVCSRGWWVQAWSNARGAGPINM